MTSYHAKYFAHELTRRHGEDGVLRLSRALFDASVDLNPHQIDAALFALRSPLSKGALLADEVGLGKTIEAGLVLCQYWAERRRRLLVVCPASLRKQWSMELLEKFHLPNVVVDSTSYKKMREEGYKNPFDCDQVVIVSMHFASSRWEELLTVPFDLVVIDEAHKLRNVYRPDNKLGRNIRRALADRRKILLTATPLQNSLLELYGLSTLIDDKLFGDVKSFRAQYVQVDANHEMLRERIQEFSTRTLRRQVLEYVRYTERHPITIQFRPSDKEHELYDAVSDYLSNENNIALPRQQRHLMTLILRKLLASSTPAILETLQAIKGRLESIQENLSEGAAQDSIDEEWRDIVGPDWLDEYLAETTEIDDEDNRHFERDLQAEIRLLGDLIKMGREIQVDQKSLALLEALNIGFEKMEATGAERKAVIFTESRRTQQYLFDFLEEHGYAGEIVLFSGTNTDASSREIITRWLNENGDGARRGSRVIDERTALINHFRNEASIMIATEAAAEGINLQFCSLVINYDLPWNPQRVEQRIGRCHRYGQKHDVVVINFLNKRNAADQRIYELLSEKFHLFDGVFGSSDEVIGSLESGVDIEKRILDIYQRCRSEEEIEAAFTSLQREMEESINVRMANTRRLLMENFDEEVHERLKIQLDDAQASLDRTGRMFWALSRFILSDVAHFHDEGFRFDLHQSPAHNCPAGIYQLVSKVDERKPGTFLYRLSHPLGEWVLDQGKTWSTPTALLQFNITDHPRKITVIEALKGHMGWLVLERLTIDSYDREEHLLFTAFTDGGQVLDQEICERLFLCTASVVSCEGPNEEVEERLRAAALRHREAVVAKALQQNEALFHEERERLERWADDMVLSAEKELADTRAQLRRLRREARVAPTLEEQSDIQKRKRELERRQRRQRRAIFDVEDEIAARRDELIDALERRMRQKVDSETLFMIRWEVV